MLAYLCHHIDMRKTKPKQTPQSRKLPGKNPEDPMWLAKSVVEAAIGETLTPKPVRKKAKVK